MAPVIKLDHDAELKLTAWAIATGGYPRGFEFSGLGIIEREGTDIFHVKDVELLNVGSYGYTEFEFTKSQLQDKPGCKLWFHRHPIEGWSGRDERTATKEPMGTAPQLVQWSLAIVLTPNGWIGRVDIHVPKSQTFHFPVEPALASPETLAEAEALLTPELMDYVHHLKQEFAASQGMQEVRFPRPFEDADFDIYDEEPLFGEDNVVCPSCGFPCEYEGGEDVFGIIGLQVYCCNRSCGNYIVIADPHSCDLYTVQEAPRRKKSKGRPWRQSFMNFWRGK